MLLFPSRKWQLCSACLRTFVLNSAILLKCFQVWKIVETYRVEYIVKYEYGEETKMCVDRDGKGGKEEKNRKERRTDYTSWCSQRAQSSVLLTMYSLSKNNFFMNLYFLRFNEAYIHVVSLSRFMLTD